MAKAAARGVVPDGETGKWTWVDPDTDSQGELYTTRDEARAEYQKHLDSGPVPAGAGSDGSEEGEEEQGSDGEHGSEEEGDGDDENGDGAGAENEEGSEEEETEPEVTPAKKKGAPKAARGKKAAVTKEEPTVATKTKKDTKGKAAPARAGGPVAKARGIFTKMAKARRKDVIAACVKAGINENTAKTYYQRWFSSKGAK